MPSVPRIGFWVPSRHLGHSLWWFLLNVTQGDRVRPIPRRKSSEKELQEGGRWTLWILLANPSRKNGEVDPAQEAHRVGVNTVYCCPFLHCTQDNPEILQVWYKIQDELCDPCSVEASHPGLIHADKVHVFNHILNRSLGVDRRLQKWRKGSLLKLQQPRLICNFTKEKIHRNPVDGHLDDRRIRQRNGMDVLNPWSCLEQQW